MALFAGMDLRLQTRPDGRRLVGAKNSTSRNSAPRKESMSAVSNACGAEREARFEEDGFVEW